MVEVEQWMHRGAVLANFEKWTPFNLEDNIALERGGIVRIHGRGAFREQ